MSSPISGLAGHNFYLDEGTEDEVKLNTAPVPADTNFVVSELDPDTDYNGRLSVTAVDNAGNESAHVAITTGAHTLDPIPEEEPMSAPDSEAIDAIVAECIADGAGPYVALGIVSPHGYYFQGYGGTYGEKRFRIASQTKLFTGTAVLQAIDNELLAFDDTLEQLVPGVPNGGDITVEHMLTMTSGIFDHQTVAGLGQQFVLNPSSAMTVDQMINYIKTGTPMFEPGEGYHYTNGNYFLLGKVLEAVDPDERTCDQIIMEDVVTPAGMSNTYWPVTTGGLTSPFITGYDYSPILAFFGVFQYRDVTTQNPAYIWASGAIVSTISDMIKLGQAMRDGTLLSPEMHELHLTTFPDPHPMPAWGLNQQGPTSYEYGYGLYRIGSWYGHGGSWLGYDSGTMFLPGTGTVITVMENFQTAKALSMTTLWYEIAEHLHPGSTSQPGYATGGPFTGGMAATVGPVSASMSGGIPGAVEMPFTLPGTFELV